MKKISQSFLDDDAAATAIEYALIACLIAMAIIASAIAVGTNLNAAVARVSNSIT